MSHDDVRMNKLRELAAQYEVKTANIIKIRELEDYKILCICDDSGSMATNINEENADPFAKRRRRWDELRETMGIIAEFASCLDPNGVDLYFLNRSPVLQVTSSAQVANAFAPAPSGFTPIVRCLNAITNALRNHEKKVLILLATDGQPTDDNGNDNLNDFLQTVRSLPANFFLSIIACSDDQSEVDYLAKLDSYPRVDVTDDYRSEKAESKSKTNTNLTFGDYICKALAGSVVQSFDQLDGAAAGVAGVSLGAKPIDLTSHAVVHGAVVAPAVVGQVVGANVGSQVSCDTGKIQANSVAGSESVDLNLEVIDNSKRVTGNVKIRLSYTADQRSILVTRIECTNLKSVEMLGKNDVYVSLHWSGVSVKTKVLDAAGSSALFTEPLQLNAPPTKILLPNLQVSVFDDNSTRKDTLIGSQDVDITGLLRRNFPASVANEVRVVGSVDLLFKGSFAGTVKLTYNQTPFEYNTISVFKIECTRLRSLGMLSGKNDVFVTLEWGNGHKFKTDVHNDAGDATNFNVEFPITFPAGASQIKVCAYDDNALRSDTLLGDAVLTLPLTARN